MVLLDATRAVASAARCDVVALHVHHGLSPNADAWAEFCRAACDERRVPFAMRHVHVQRVPRASLEAEARAARYAALAKLADEQRVIALLLAHHADDQAETLLLRLLRGAGPPGLAAMPPVRRHDGRNWLRPFLALPRARLEAYAAKHALRYVDDESNDDVRHRRNALRARVVPALRSIAPGYPATLSRAARHQAEAAALLDDLARLDAQHALVDAALDRAKLRALEPPRARNLLRWFLAHHGLRSPSAARLDEMLHQLCTASADARVALRHAGAEVGVHRGRNRVHRPPPVSFCRTWNGEPRIELPHGMLALTPRCSTGIAARHLDASTVTIRAGVAGERLQLAGRTRRPVADLLREAGVPQWDRLALPRVYCGESLAAVASLGIDAAFAAAPGDSAFALEWRPSPNTACAPMSDGVRGTI
jgi:tRNA(Ile)-lysidine synthase